MIWLNSLAFFLFMFFQPSNVVSLKMEAKTLNGGKVVSTKGEVYYRNSDGLMVTHFAYPFDYLVFVNAKGEVKMYDPKNNTILLREGADLSSENSFFFQFFNGGVSDMGLRRSGFTISKTRKEGSVIVTEWKPKDKHSPVGKIELAHEAGLPVSMFLYDQKGGMVQKIFYSKYSKIGSVNLPMNVTEIAWTTPKDSVISKRWYTVPGSSDKMNADYLNFKIPANAKAIN